MATAFGKDHREIRYQGGFEMRNGIFHLVTGTAIAIALSVSSAYAQQKYDTGASDTEIKIGQTVPFSGPASAYATIGKAQAAYIKMVNEQGGVNGRKINFIQYDDAYSPPQAVQRRRSEIPQPEKGAAIVRRHRRVQIHRSEELPLDDRLQPQLPDRRTHLRTLHSDELSQRQDRHPLSKRRPRPRLCHRPEGGSRRQGGEHDRRRNLL